MTTVSLEHIDIIGIDPGKTTGIAEFRDHCGIGMYELREEDVVHHVQKFISVAKSREVKSHPIIIAVERFTIRQGTHRMTHQPTALHVIGALREAFNSNSDVIISVQQPATAKKLGKKSLLHTAKLYSTTMPHANDAARHVLVALLKYYPNFFDAMRTNGKIDLSN